MHTVVRLLAALCIAALALSGAAGTAAAQSAADGQFVVELDADGDADAAFTEEFDLTAPEDREIFEEVQADADLRAAVAERFGEEMRFVSGTANEGIDRELRVGEVTVETAAVGETGIVVYEFRWENLAAVDDDRVVLAEPFSLFETLDRELVVVAPEGYEIESASPEPERDDGDTVAWPGMTTFGEGFEVVAAPASGGEMAPIEHSPERPVTHGGAPLALGISALILVSLLVGRKR
ncbi:hypothetical protein [Natronomonas sp. LN261]|jgi:hypothetical protein|uniref:DUF7345 domain-containing protein n=1 Tax=Natronomonas sp. LN261 TaxID=2750669 RepID=UPI0015EF44B8|nr:hypothetical protein [Natronomonas sp. LN261]